MAILKKRNVSTAKTMAIIGVLLLVVGATVALWLSQAPSGPDNQVTLTYRLTVTNTTNKPIKGAGIRFLAPAVQTAYQQCRRIKVNYNHTAKSDDTGNHSIAIDWEVFPPFASKIVVVKTVLDTWRRPRKVNAVDLNSYTKPGTFIESEDRGVVELARSLRRGSDMQTAREIYQWVADHIAYSGYARRTRGAAYALANKKGDCTEFACLFAALCRANGIAARVVGGLACPRDMAADMADYHNWAEFYAKGRWIIADPQKKIFNDNENTYIDFTIQKNMETGTGLILSDVKGDGLTVKHN